MLTHLVHNKKSFTSYLFHKELFINSLEQQLNFQSSQQSAFHTKKRDENFRVKYLSESHEFLCKINSIICLLQQENDEK